MKRRRFVSLFGLILTMPGCIHNSNSKNVSLDVTPDSASLPRANLEATLTNEGRKSLNTNFYNWNILKRIGKTWIKIAPIQYKLPTMGLGNGESHTWNINIDNENPDFIGNEIIASKKDIELSGLGPGTYSFRTFASYGSLDEAKEYRADFVIKGETIKIEPTKSVTIVSQTDQEIEISTLVTGGEPTSLIIEKVNNEKEMPELVLEQITQIGVLRNTLPYIIERGVNKVSITTGRRSSRLARIALTGYGIDEENGKFAFKYGKEKFILDFTE